MNSSTPKPQGSARIDEWNAEKGYGWLQWGDKRLFLHRRDYSGPQRTPVVGEQVHFLLGQDSQGRPCAVRAVSTRGGGSGRGFLSLAVLCGLLVLPAVAIHRYGIEGWKAAAYVLSISMLTYAAYANDKRRARSQSWRIPEAHLHLLELLGGWPGAWLAQRQLRHKCSKGSYQCVFWLIILAHQFAAYDSQHEWSLTREALQKSARVFSGR